jgi:hypothetical protein
MDRVAQSIQVSLDDTSHILAHCALSKELIVVEDARTDPRVREDFRALIGADQFVVAPLIARNETVGVLVADNLYTGEPVTEENLELLAMFANQAAIAIENAESYHRIEEEKRHLEQAYRDLAEAQDKLVRSERLVAIGRMAAHVAHEIRNPLVNIGGFAKAMTQREDMPHETVAKYSGIIVDEVRRLEGILGRVMDFSKPPRPLMRQARIRPVLAETLDQFRERAKRQGVHISAELPDEGVVLYIDPDQIKQVFLNLFQNALDVMQDGGTLTIGNTVEDADLVLSVRNTGRPIHPEDLANLFEPFFTTKPGGTGLGLTVSQKIIHDHGGDIRVASSLDYGTEFTLALPLERRPDRAARHQKPSQEAPGS